MDDFDLERQIGRGEDCPSETILDRLHWGEIDQGEAARLRYHIASCDQCRQRMALRGKGFDAFPELRPGALRARIERAVGEMQIPQKRGFFTPGRLLALSAAAALVVLIAVVIGLQTPTPVEDDSVRIKGTVRLSVLRERNGKVEEAQSGDVFHPGDRLRFRVSLTADCEIMVVGMEESGRVYTCFPVGKEKSRPLEAGVDRELAGAIRLDESVGEEWIHLVLCPRPFSVEDLEASERPGEIGLPKGCRSTKFKMKKETP